jgi:membrane protease YdiL (CAAX protease family)
LPGPLDHLFIAIIIAGIPLKGVFHRRKLMKSLERGEPYSKLNAYSTAMAWQWGAAAVLAVYWWSSGRSFDALGIRAPAASGLVISAAAILLTVTVLFAQVRSIQARPDLAERVRAQTASLAFMLPGTSEELRRFTWLGITAGIVEEFICRGYVIWYFASYVSWWTALALSSIVFGIGHLYQGFSGVIKTSVMGMYLGSLYRWSGALWAPMIVHAAVDVLSGRAVYFANSRPPSASTSEAA